MISYDAIKSGEAVVPVANATDVRDFDLDLSEIKLDQSAQPREALNNDRIAEYADAMKAGDQFPPLTVFHDGETYWLADGFHRHYAAQHAGRKHIRCYVRQGGLRDAILWSVGANAKHGLARSDEDKKRAVMRLLDDAEWSQWSDREIARRCRVSDKTVAKYRPAASADRPQIERKVQRGGTIYTQKVAKAVKSNAREALVNDEPSPEAGPQAEASHSQDTGVGTLADREGRHEGEAASVGLPTISDVERDAAALQSVWDDACGAGQAVFMARNNLQFKSGDDAFSEVKGTARPENAAGVEPSSSDNPSTAPTVEPEATPAPPPASGTHSNPQEPTSSQVTADKAEASTSSPSASAAPFAVMSKADQIRLLRPHCQHADDLEKCAGTGRTHCHACKKLAAESEAAA